LTGSNSFKKF